MLPEMEARQSSGKKALLHLLQFIVTCGGCAFRRMGRDAFLYKSSHA
jgi:hypothetical protein